MHFTNFNFKFAILHVHWGMRNSTQYNCLMFVINSTKYIWKEKCSINVFVFCTPCEIVKLNYYRIVNINTFMIFEQTIFLFKFSFTGDDNNKLGHIFFQSYYYFIKHIVYNNIEYNELCKTINSCSRHS